MINKWLRAEQGCSFGALGCGKIPQMHDVNRVIAVRMPPQKDIGRCRFFCSQASPLTLNLIAPLGKSCIGNEAKFAQWAAHCDQYCPDHHEHPKTLDLAIQAQRIDISKQ